MTFSLEQVNSKLHPYRGAMNAIDKFEAPDKDTFVLRLKHPQVSLITSLGNFAGAILPKHIWEGKDVARDPHNRQPIGTGPYKLVEYVAGDHILYKKNEKYFLPGKPVFDELMFRIIPDPGSRVAALQKGEVDMIYASAVPAPEVARISASRTSSCGSARSRRRATRPTSTCAMRRSATARVRQALAYAIDRGFIRSNVFPGLSDNMIGPVPPTSPLHNKELADYPLDPAKANALLDEAGFAKKADGTRFELRFVYAAQDLPAAKISDIMSRNLAAVGIKVVAAAARPRRLDPGVVHQSRLRHDLGLVLARPRSRCRHRALLQLQQHQEPGRRQQLGLHQPGSRQAVRRAARAGRLRQAQGDLRQDPGDRLERPPGLPVLHLHPAGRVQRRGR